MTAANLRSVGDQLLTEAYAGTSRRASSTLHNSGRLRQTLITLVEGAELAEHESPGEATLQVLSGEVELRSGDTSVSLTSGDLVPIPSTRHSVHAGTDAMLLLTVAN